MAGLAGAHTALPVVDGESVQLIKVCWIPGLGGMACYRDWRQTTPGDSQDPNGRRAYLRCAHKYIIHMAKLTGHIEVCAG